MKRLFALLCLTLSAVSSVSLATDFPSLLGKNAAAKSPYNLIGQLYFSSGAKDYIGSGSVIRPRSILTAGHNIYDADTGWSTDLLFRRGAYGNTVRTEEYGSKIYVLGGYRQSASYYGGNDVRTFASDTGGVLFPRALAKGATVPWVANPSLLANPYTYKAAIGFGAEGAHTGDYPLIVNPDKPFSSSYGAFYESTGAYFEGGMSGGPVFTFDFSGHFLVTGVIVSGSDAPYAAGGIRVIDGTTASFIRTYLK